MRTIVSPEKLIGLLEAYSRSVGNTFYLVSAGAALGVFVSYWMGWEDVRVKKVAEVESLTSSE